MVDLADDSTDMNAYQHMTHLQALADSSPPPTADTHTRRVFRIMTALEVQQGRDVGAILQEIASKRDRESNRSVQFKNAASAVRLRERIAGTYASNPQ